MKNIDDVKDKFDRIANTYRNQYQVDSILGYEKVRRLELVKNFFQSHNPAIVLDAGCGPGISNPYLGEQFKGAKVFGIDISLQMLINAKQNNHEPVEYVQSNVEDIPFKNGIFDLVFSLGVIDYVIHPERMIQTIYRVLSPGGYFIFSYPNGNSVFRLFREAILSAHPQKRNSGFSKSVKKQKIACWLSDNKFELLHQEYITYGIGLISSSWSVHLSNLLEEKIKSRFLKQSAAWTVVCIAQKPRIIN